MKTSQFICIMYLVDCWDAINQRSTFSTHRTRLLIHLFRKRSQFLTIQERVKDAEYMHLLLMCKIGSVYFNFICLIDYTGAHWLSLSDGSCFQAVFWVIWSDWHFIVTNSNFIELAYYFFSAQLYQVIYNSSF